MIHAPHNYSTIMNIRGTVKYYGELVERGLILGNDGREYLVEKTGLRNCIYLSPGDKVSFKPKEGFGVNEAVNVDREY